MFRLGSGVVTLATLLAIAAPAAAQSGDTDRQIAQQLFDDGRALLEARRYAEACPKFAESQRLDPGGGTLVNLAYCHELEGKTATAWSEFRDALAQALKDDRKDREELTRQHITDLAPRLMRVIVQVPESLAAQAPEVTFDRSKLSEAAWNTAIPVDPGEHRVTLSIGGTLRSSVPVVVSEEGRTYSVELSPLDAPMVCREGQMRVADTCIAIPRPETPVRSTAFWVTLGGAGGLLVISAVTGIVALNADAYVKDNCSMARDFCREPDAGDAATRAKTFAWISTVTLAAAGAATIVAFVLPRTPGRAWAAGGVTLGVGSLRITGL